MIRATLASRLVSLGLVCAWALACSSTPKKLGSVDDAAKEWSSVVDGAVADPQRAAKVKELGHRLTEVQRSMAAELAALDAQAIALNADYASTAEDAHRVSRAYEAQRRKSFEKYRDLILAMRGEVTEAEWKKLTK